MPYDRENFTKLSPFSSFATIKRMALRGQLPSLQKGVVPRDCGTWDLWTLELSNDLARLGVERTVAAKAVQGAIPTLRTVAIELDAQPYLTRHFVLASYERGVVVGLAGLLSGIVDYLHLPNSRQDLEIADGDDFFGILTVNATAALARIKERARKHKIALDPLTDGTGTIPRATPSRVKRGTRSQASGGAARLRRAAKRPTRRRV